MAADITYPVVLKPTFKENYYEATRKKAILCRNRDELASEYAAMGTTM